MTERTAAEICRICGEPRSAHVVTDAGPFTHPREARGEGTYRLASSGSAHLGLDCTECAGPCEGHPFEQWVFVPATKTSAA